MYVHLKYTTKKDEKYLFEDPKHKKWEIMWYIVVTLWFVYSINSMFCTSHSSTTIPSKIYWNWKQNKLNIVSIWMNKLWHGMAHLGPRNSNSKMCFKPVLYETHVSRRDMYKDTLKNNNKKNWVWCLYICMFIKYKNTVTSFLC